jgi:hypothetical protein
MGDAASAGAAVVERAAGGQVPVAIPRTDRPQADRTAGTAGHAAPAVEGAPTFRSSQVTLPSGGTLSLEGEERSMGSLVQCNYGVAV